MQIAGLDLELQSSATAAPTVFPTVPSPPQTDEERARVEQETAKDRLDKSDLLTSFTRRERQAQALYSANDYLQVRTSFQSPLWWIYGDMTAIEKVLNIRNYNF